MRTDYTDATPEEREAALKEAGFSLEAAFIPFSQSRNAKSEKGEKVWRSLNWKVTLSKDGRALATTDYAQGEAHCQASKQKDHYDRAEAVAMEIETGKIARVVSSLGAIGGTKSIPAPTLTEVCYSLASDSRSGQGSFAEFCGEFGYDPDSRKAEATWRVCADVYAKLGARITEQIGRICEGY